MTVGRVNPRARRVRGGRVRHSGSAEESEEDFEGWESEAEGDANDGWERKDENDSSGEQEGG